MLRNVFRAPSVLGGRRVFASVLLLLFVIGTTAGCGGKPETDPETDPNARAVDELDITQVEETPFSGEGDAIGDGSVSGDDLLGDTRPLPTVQDVFFSYDSFELDAEARAALQSNARILLENPGLEMTIEGHCDERGTAQYNMALGWKRAEEVKRYLVTLRVPATRMETVSFGKERPFVRGSGEDVWAQNRRAHFVLHDTGR